MTCRITSYNVCYTKLLRVSGAAEGFDPEDVQIFVQANQQQIDNLELALSTLRKDSDNTDYVDGLYRSLVV